ncbi:putative damage-inducible protein DinB [Winogradskyella wandonensis]|uniref:Putative damage-inducible protein DinB n=1 Tax=Winogradskyella wandonensis TaxID=1442586 RepID=A0A4R1KVL7_9FLAO|nr:DinB family protein [Winogradskyella wandonensis]TCK68767.1 putative damage-inducible protein DinB [Winogradskyella wandonensis]
MNHNEYLANRLREILLNGKWVTGTNFKEQIEDLTWIEATKKVENFNTIASLTFHINYYLSGVMDVFKGGELTIRDKFSFDAPEIKNENDWNELKETFIKNSERFIGFVQNMKTEQLMSAFVKEDYGSYYRNIDVMIEHTYYHLGQIILIKKMI